MKNSFLNNVEILKKIVENSDLIIMITDIDGKILYVNKKFTDVTQYTPEEVLGKKPSILKSGIHPEEFYENLWQTVLSGKTWEDVFVNRKKDGTIYYEHATISPVYNDKGQIEYLIGIKNDVTERVDIIDKSTRSMSNHVPLGLVVVDSEHKIVFANKTSEKLLKLPLLKIKDKPIEEVITFFSSKNKPLKILPTRKEKKNNIVIVKTNKNTFLADLIISPIKKYKQIFGYIILMNQLEHKQIKIKDTGFITEQQLAVFLKGFSHDLNNLLAVLEVQLEVGAMAMDKSPDKAKKSLKKASETVSNIGKLVYSFYKAIGEAPQLAETNLNNMIKNIVNDFKKRYKNTEFYLDEKTEIVLPIDKNKIKFAIEAILQNAVEAQEEKGKVEIEIAEASKEEILPLPIENGEYAKITIKDFGKGIKHEHLPLLFTPYFTTKKRSSQKQTGLSLALCNFHVKKHGGYIRVITQEGEGTEFTIYLPLKQDNFREKSLFLQ